jgi:hypothetical protein
MLAQDLITALIRKQDDGVLSPQRAGKTTAPLDARCKMGHDSPHCRLMLDAQHMFQRAVVHNTGEWCYSTS